MNTPNLKVGVIGNDQMVISCLEILRNTKGFNIEFVLFDKKRVNTIGNYCDKHGLEYKGLTSINSEEIYTYIKNKKPDYILSINNFWIIRSNILSIPTKATINFHNSIPSKYHGLNIPSWVIMNQEVNHGSMWHFVEPTIDTGDVIAFTEFPLEKNETASSLMVKCIQEGIKLFPKVLQQAQEDKFTRMPQQSGCEYYGKKEYPGNMGYIDFTKSGAEIDALVRGLNYLPFENTFIAAKLKHGEVELIVNSVEIEKYIENSNPGKIVFVDDENFHVECADSIVNIVDTMDADYEEYEGKSISNYLGTAVNEIIRK